jgi:hypothetical protein
MTLGYNGLDLPSPQPGRLLQVERSQSLSMMSDGDAALVARTLDGDLDAYAKLMARYRDTLGAYALHMLGTREDAQEAVQDSFVRAYRALRGCRQPGAIRGVALPDRGESLSDDAATVEAEPPVRRASP